MGLLSRISAAWSALRSMENPRRPLDPWGQALGDSLDGSLSASGVRVNREKALTCPAFWRGVVLLSDTVGKLPLSVHRRSGPGTEVDLKHPACRLILRAPNEAMTAITLRAAMQGHAVCHGNGYGYVYRRADGSPRELWLLDPERTWPVVEGRRRWYVHELKGGERRKLPAEDVLHVMGHSHDGLEGVSVLRKAREALGLALGTQAFASTFFRNNARPNTALKHPQRLSPEARRNLREGWERMHSGLDNAHRTAILEEGMDVVQLSINAQDAQLLESRQFSLIEIANVLGLPPHKLGSSVNVSYKSLEQENQAFLDESVDPWLVRWEQECDLKLLSPFQRERDTHCVRFDRFPLVRADLQQRGEYYNKAIAGGWMSPDEARAREGQAPLPAGLGAVYFRPLNLGAVGGDPDGPGGPAVAPGSELLAVPDVRQEGDYDCGPAAAQAVCRFFGVGPADRGAYLDALDTTRKGGTRPEALVALFSRLGLVATAAGGLEVADLGRFFALGQPVLCPVQAGEPGGETSGHWVVVVGVGLGQVFFHDPAAGLRMTAEADWLARWHDRDGDGVGYDAFGVAVGEDLPRGPEPAPAPDEAPDDAPPEGPPAETKPAEGEAARALAALAEATVGRMVRRLRTHAERAANQPGQFLAWLDTMGGEHGLVVAEALAPVASLAGRRGLPPDLIGELRAGLLEVSGRAKAAGLPAAVRGYFDALDVRALASYKALVEG